MNKINSYFFPGISFISSPKSWRLLCLLCTKMCYLSIQKKIEIITSRNNNIPEFRKINFKKLYKKESTSI